MKVRVGNVVFEDFNANELDIVIEKLKKVGLLGSGSSGGIQAPKPIPKPVVRPTPIETPKPVLAPAPKPVPVQAPKPTPQTTLPQAPTPPKPKQESSVEEESSSSGWL